MIDDISKTKHRFSSLGFLIEISHMFLFIFFNDMFVLINTIKIILSFSRIIFLS